MTNAILTRLLAHGRVLSLAAATVLFAASAHAQFGSNATQVHDSSALHPPAGARVALIEFADMECPMCARDNPIFKDAVAKYHIPWLRYDFPLSMHVWSRDAAINARWFDLKSKELGNEYRDYIFANQQSIIGKLGLRQITDRFAKSKNLQLPFSIDPQGKLEAAVSADYVLGQRINIDHTPTAWVVVSGKGAPYREVVDINQLYQMLDQALADAAPAKAAAKPATKKPAAK